MRHNSSPFGRQTFVQILQIQMTKDLFNVYGGFPGGSIGKESTCTEKAMAAHSSTFAWKIPWMEEPGGLPSMLSHRVRLN